MSILSHVETAEEALRQALINSLAEKQDTNLTELVNALNSVRDLVGKLQHTKYNFNLTSDYLNSGYISYNYSSSNEQSRCDNVITFGSSSSEDKISLGLD